MHIESNYDQDHNCINFLEALVLEIISFIFVGLKRFSIINKKNLKDWVLQKFFQ